jgi:hypothetical protein
MLLFFLAFCLKSILVLVLGVILVIACTGGQITQVKLIVLGIILLVTYLNFGMDFSALFSAFEEEMWKVGVLQGLVDMMRHP